MLTALSLILTLCTTTISSAPAWVPDKHKDAFDRLEASLRRFTAILRASRTITGCKVENGIIVLSTERFDLPEVLEIKITDPDNKLTISSCKAVEHGLEISTSIERDQSPGLRQCLTHASYSFGAGFVAGIAACAAIK